METLTLIGEYEVSADAPVPASHMKLVKPASTRPPVPRRDMTPDELVAVKLLGEQVTYTPASWDKRFAREHYQMTTLSEKESAQVWRLFKRYRRQIHHPEKERLLALAETLAAPELRRK